MLRVGLTGGIGSGKSTVSEFLAREGAIIIDSDALARHVVAPGTPGLQALVGAFGREILLPDGSLNREFLAQKTFGNAQARSTLNALNAIVHPLVRKRSAELVAAAPAHAVIVHDIPLLTELTMAPQFHMVIVVHADISVRRNRLISQRNMTENDVIQRISAQASDEQRRAVADVWLDNNSDLSDLQQQVQSLWKHRLIPFENNVRARRVVRGQPRVVDHNPEWELQAQRLISRLKFLCGDAALRIDHIGPTAQADKAPDVIDLQITVRDLQIADELTEVLTEGGFPRIEGVERLHGGADPAQPMCIFWRVETI